MTFTDFKIKYAETMLNYQRIENDIKCIYAYMRVGGMLLSILKKLKIKLQVE